MKKLYYWFSFVFTLLMFLSSCKNHSSKVDLIFKNVENLVEQYPDSALILLDSIQNPYGLNKNQYAKYILLSVQAKDKAYKNIASDTLIFQVCNYYERKNDLKNLALSQFYCGRVLQSQEKNEVAMKNYLMARSTAEKINNHYLDGLVEFFIGELNYNQRLYDDAISHYKSAIIEFSHFDDKYKNQIVSFTNIGNSFLLTELPDSAFFYYHKGLELAKLANDSITQIITIQNMGVAFLKIGLIDSAKKLTMQALPLATNKDMQAKLYLNLSNIYNQENKKDSALYYSNLALDLSENNNFLKTSIFKLLSKIEESTGNYQKSLNYQRQYTKYLSAIFEEEEENSNILDIQKKYDFELLQNANKKLVIQRLCISIISILLIAVVSFFYYRNRIQNKEALLTAKQQIYQLKEITNKKDINSGDDIKNKEINNRLRTILFKLLDTYKKMSLLEGYLRDDEKEKGKNILKRVNDIIYDSNDKFDWEIFYQSVNALHDNFLVHLTDLYPILDKEDILICCLSKIRFNNTEIAFLMESNQNIVQKKKSAIREKTGMKKQESFLKQLDEIVKTE